MRGIESRDYQDVPALSLQWRSSAAASRRINRRCGRAVSARYRRKLLRRVPKSTWLRGSCAPRARASPDCQLFRKPRELFHRRHANKFHFSHAPGFRFITTSKVATAAPWVRRATVRLRRSKQARRATGCTSSRGRPHRSRRAARARAQRRRSCATPRSL